MSEISPPPLLSLGQPTSVVYSPKLNVFFVSDRGDGTVKFFKSAPGISASL